MCTHAHPHPCPGLMPGASPYPQTEEGTMATARDVAAYIMATGHRTDRFGVQKLAYYAQAWHLVWEGRPLYREGIEAWPSGPVVRDVWIAQQHEAKSSRDMPGGDPTALSEEERASIDAVLDHYGSKTGPQLVDLTHSEAPWIEARDGLAPTTRSQVEIEPRSMRAYYTRQSITGADVPRRRPVQTAQVHDRARARAIVQEESRRWADTLAELAAR